MTESSPFISIIIPIKNLSYSFIHENLLLFMRQKYRRYEIIVLPNKISKNDKLLLKKYRNKLRIISTRKITRPAEKRDIGAKLAKGEIIAFIDDDAYPEKNWLKNSAVLFNRKKVQAVCGPGILPHKTNIWEKIFDEVLKSKIGSGAYSYRFKKEKERYVTDYPSMNFLILKKTFRELGGFNSDYWPGEDSKLCNDLVEKLHGKILYSPDVIVFHHRRNKLRGFLKQHGRYGFHRGAFYAHGDKNSRKISYLIPSVFFLYIIFIICLFMINYLLQIKISAINLYLLPISIYAILCFYLFAAAFKTSKNLAISMGSVLTLFLTHIIYGFMFIFGFIKGLKGKNIYD